MKIVNFLFLIHYWTMDHFPQILTIFLRTSYYSSFLYYNGNPARTENTCILLKCMSKPCDQNAFF